MTLMTPSDNPLLLHLWQTSKKSCFSMTLTLHHLPSLSYILVVCIAFKISTISVIWIWPISSAISSTISGFLANNVYLKPCVDTQECLFSSYSVYSSSFYSWYEAISICYCGCLISTLGYWTSLSGVVNRLLLVNVLGFNPIYFLLLSGENCFIESLPIYFNSLIWSIVYSNCSFISLLHKFL